MKTNNDKDTSIATATLIESNDPNERAHNEVQPEALALRPKDLEVFNANVQYAVGIVLVKKKLLDTLRPEIEEQLPKFKLASLDRIETYARALDFSQSRFLAMSTAPVDLTTLRTNATALRDLLKTDAKGLVGHGLFEGTLLSNLSSSTADHDTVSDLMALNAAFRCNHESIAGKTAVTAVQLESARMLGHQLLLASMQRIDPRTATTVALADDRQRIFTLFVRAYSQVRRAVTFLRWDEDDVDHFAPALYPGRPRRSKAATIAAPTAAPAQPAPSAPAVSPSDPLKR